MGETKDGPSMAAHGAQKGIWNKLKAYFNSEVQDTSADDAVSTIDGKASASYSEMLINLRNIMNIRVRDVAIPKADIIAVSKEISLKELIEVFKESTFTRLPVFNETLDQPIGLLHLKDVMLEWGFGATDKVFDVTKLLRPLLYVPPSMKIDVLLQKMQNERQHMALVIDEYGGVDGLVTIEDLLEEVVGDIADEHDEEEQNGWVEEAPSVYLVNARESLEEFQSETGLSIFENDDEVDTFGGLVFRLRGQVPIRGEVISDENGNEFEVLEADSRRIKRLRIRFSESNLKQTVQSDDT